MESSNPMLATPTVLVVKRVDGVIFVLAVLILLKLHV